MDLLYERTDYRSMNMLLEYLAGYGADHHSRAIDKILHVCVKNKLPALSSYLDSRLQQTETVARIKKGMIREKNPIGICAASYWMSVDATD
jgi:hypothetical protein